MSRGDPGIKVAVRLPRDMIHDLQRLAAERGTTVSAVVRSIIHEHGKTEALVAQVERVLQLLESGAVRGGTAPVGQEAGPDPQGGDRVPEPATPTGDGAQSEDDLIRDVRSILAGFGADDSE